MPGSDVRPVSDAFRMGMREARAVLTKGSLHTQLNSGQIEIAARVFASANAESIAGWLDDVSGPINACQDPAMTSNPINAKMAKISMLLTTTLVREMGLVATAEASHARANVLAVADGLCHWIDFGGDRGESAQLSHLMTCNSPDSAAAGIRLGALVRYSCALGLAERLLDVQVWAPYGVRAPNLDATSSAKEAQHAGLH